MNAATAATLAGAAVADAPDDADLEDDLERRFGGLRRLYGDTAYRQLRAASVAVVGLGGVGSWTAEALARSGVARLVLVDLDHVSTSNINRQVQATGRSLGQHKGQALRERIADIHPGCDVRVVDDFAGPDNWPGLLPVEVHAVVDACDQVRAKLALASWSLRSGVPLVSVGAAGGKRQAQRVEVEDLADTTHDPLLASLRQRLRKDGAGPRQGRIGLRCVFSREPVVAPVLANAGEACETSTGGACETNAGENCETSASAGAGGSTDGSLNCHGYGSSVAVTATFGMVAAGEAIAQLLAKASR